MKPSQPSELKLQLTDETSHYAANELDHTVRDSRQSPDDEDKVGIPVAV